LAQRLAQLGQRLAQVGKWMAKLGQRVAELAQLLTVGRAVRRDESDCFFCAFNAQPFLQELFQLSLPEPPSSI
jgi:hypothetical protein